MMSWLKSKAKTNPASESLLSNVFQLGWRDVVLQFPDTASQTI